MGTAFDGVGERYRGPSWRGPIIVLIVSVLVIAGLWLAYSQVMSDGGTLIPMIPIESPAPSG